MPQESITPIPAADDLSPQSSSPPGASASPRRQTQRSSSSLQLSRRTSAQDRINSILETARERAEFHGLSSSPHSPRLQPLLRTESDGPAPLHESSGEDDGVVIKQPRRQHTLNYQSTASATTSDGPRARKSASRKSTSHNGHGRNGHGQAPAGGPDRSGDSSGTVVGTEDNEKKWWQRTLANFQSIELENKGSVARDHLALERTFLAWLRTSLAFASIGIAITQLFRLNTSISNGEGSPDTIRHLGRPLGTIFLGISILILFLGYNRYFQSQKWVIKGKFPASRGTIMFVSLVSFALIVVALVVVVAVQPSGA